VSGLYWFEDSGSSGMDNSPRSGYAADHLDGSDVCFIDLAGQQILSAQHLAKIADHLGETAVAERFRSEYARIKRLINDYHWSEKAGIYFDLFGRSAATSRHNFLNHKTLAAYWTVLAGVAEGDRLTRMIEHLINPDEFWTPHPLPTLSRDDPNYDPLGGYWLGGVWPPTNYMVAAGLARRNRRDLARDLSMKHLAAMARVLANESTATVWECYSPEYDRPATNGYGKVVRPDFVGWTGLGPIAMFLEFVLGLEFDAPTNRLTWHLLTPGEHAVENLGFNRRTLALRAAAVDPATGARQLTVETTDTLQLTIHGPSDWATRSYDLPAGRHELSTAR